MSRLVSLVLVVALVTGFAFADAKKAAEKIRKAEIAFQRHDVAGAEKQLREAIKEDPESIDAHTMLATLLEGTQRYSQAAQEYGRVVDIDAQQHKLSDTDRRRAIDGQAVSYAESGDLARAKTLYLNALAKDPDYSMYNYNLACVYAEMHDLDSAIPYLKKSWDNRDTLPSDIKYPDPRQDSSFKAYLDDPRFQDAVRNMVQ